MPESEVDWAIGGGAEANVSAALRIRMKRNSHIKALRLSKHNFISLKILKFI